MPGGTQTTDAGTYDGNTGHGRSCCFGLFGIKNELNSSNNIPNSIHVELVGNFPLKIRPMARISYKAQIQRMREDSIVDAVNRLLVSKGYDNMTVDEVAAEAGMAKASLYKHFASKEELAAAAMVRALDRALAFVDQLRALEENSPLEQLKRVTRWAMRSQLEGNMPSLPSQNSSLTASLMTHEAYMDRLIGLSNKLGTWITEAQTQGELHGDFPLEMILYTLFSRACDPVVAMLKSSGQYTDEQILDWVSASTFDGLKPRLG
jgi:AcrR family transcriptional regulator